MEGLIFGILGIIFHFFFVDQSIFLPVLMATTTQVVKTEFFIITEMTILKELRNEGTTLVPQTAGHSAWLELPRKRMVRSPIRHVEMISSEKKNTLFECYHESIN